MKNRTLIVAALVMVLLCVGLIFLGLRHENAGGGSPGQSQTTDGQAADGATETPSPRPSRTSPRPWPSAVTS